MQIECLYQRETHMTKQRSLHQALEKIEAGSKAARLRTLMPEIEQRLAAGVRIIDVVQTLTENGLPITSATLKSYLYRFRKASREDQANVGSGWPGDRPRQLSSGVEDLGSLATKRTSTTPGLLRHINTARCLRLLRRGATLSRAELARELGLTRATIGSAIGELLEAGLVIDAAERPEGGRLGRPGSGVCLNPKGAYSIGIDISSISLTGVLVDLEMRVVHRINVPVGPRVDDVVKTVEQIAQFPARLLTASGVDPSRVQGVCVSAPGLVDHGGRVVVAPFLRWHDVPLKELLSARRELPWPVMVCNDAVAFANAERTVANEKDARNMLLILLTEGLGGAIVQRGQIFEGAHGYAGEIGHMIMGASPKAIATQTFELLAGYERFRPYLPGDRSLEEGLTWLANAGASELTPALKQVFTEWAQILATGMLNLVYLLDPEKIVLGGPLSVLFPRIAVEVDGLLAANLLHGFTAPPIHVTRFGVDGAAIGAASVVRDQIFSLPRLDPG
jgi:predicted NBD/HSP70 family sugar kinase/biotin operon repressor